jgi:hypothetical protein
MLGSHDLLLLPAGVSLGGGVAETGAVRDGPASAEGVDGAEPPNLPRPRPRATGERNARLEATLRAVS